VLKKLVTDDGWYPIRRNGGSHQQYKHRVKKGGVTMMQMMPVRECWHPFYSRPRSTLMDYSNTSLNHPQHSLNHCQNSLNHWQNSLNHWQYSLNHRQRNNISLNHSRPTTVGADCMQTHGAAACWEACSRGADDEPLQPHHHCAY